MIFVNPEKNKRETAEDPVCRGSREKLPENRVPRLAKIERNNGRRIASGETGCGELRTHGGRRREPSAAAVASVRPPERNESNFSAASVTIPVRR